MNKTKTINNTLNEKTSEQEKALATELELVTLLREHPDILIRHPELLPLMQVPHNAGGASSLIERQVAVLRQQIKSQDQHLRELMALARDNDRLGVSLHNLAVSLLSASDLDDVISLLLDTFSNELGADYAVIRLFTDDASLLEQAPEQYISHQDKGLVHFKTMLEQRAIICGKPVDEQKSLLFDDHAASIRSAAVIPLVSGANLGLIGLGSNKSSRFTSSMGTEFLNNVGELASTAIARHQ